MSETDTIVNFLYPTTLAGIALKKIWTSRLEDPIYRNSVYIANILISGKLPIYSEKIYSLWNLPHFRYKKYTDEKSEIVIKEPYYFIVGIEKGGTLKIGNIFTTKLTLDTIFVKGIEYRLLQYPIYLDFWRTKFWSGRHCTIMKQKETIHVLYADIDLSIGTPFSKPRIIKAPPFIIRQPEISQLNREARDLIDKKIFGNKSGYGFADFF